MHTKIKKDFHNATRAAIATQLNVDESDLDFDKLNAIMPRLYATAVAMYASE